MEKHTTAFTFRKNKIKGLGGWIALLVSVTIQASGPEFELQNSGILS